MLVNFINTIKYSKDDPKSYEIKIQPSNDVDYNSNPDAYLLTSSMQIKNDLFPKIYQSISEVKEILQLDDAKFCKLLEESPKVIRNIKLNKSPFIIPIEYMKDINYALDPSLEEIFKRHNFILENKEFRTRVTKFFEERINSLEKTSSQIDLYAEETIYKNFIKRNDAETAKDFHNGSWNERLLIRNKFKDERLNYFANLIIYEEQPQLLEKDLVKKIQRTICERLLSNNNEKWLTIYNAYKIIDDLRAKDNIQNNYTTLSFLDDLNKYIETVEKKLQKYTI